MDNHEHWSVLDDFLQPKEEATPGEKTDAKDDAPVPAAASGPQLEGTPPAAPQMEGEHKAVAPSLPKFQSPRISIPGSITGLLLLIVFMVLAIKPTASGETRLQVLWRVIVTGGMMRGAPDPAGHTSNGALDNFYNWQPGDVHVDIPDYLSPDTGFDFQNPFKGYSPGDKIPDGNIQDYPLWPATGVS